MTTEPQPPTRHEPSDKTTRRALTILCALIVAAIVALAYVIGSSIQSARDQANATAYSHLHDEAILTCRRLNVTRATDNDAHLQNYQLYKFLLQSTARESKARQAKEPAATKRAIRRLQGGQVVATWTPLINCTVRHEAEKSLSLNPIPFTKRLPPKTALSPANAKRPDPVGSVS